MAPQSINLPYSNRIQNQPFWVICTPASIWTLLTGSKTVARGGWVKRSLIGDMMDDTETRPWLGVWWQNDLVLGGRPVTYLEPNTGYLLWGPSPVPQRDTTVIFEKNHKLLTEPEQINVKIGHIAFPEYLGSRIILNSENEQYSILNHTWKRIQCVSCDR